MSIQHTPTPWRQTATSDINARDGANSTCVGTCYHSPGKMVNGEREANAAYIVKACNEHDELTAIKEQVSDALAMLHAPGFDNNGGPSNIADEVRLLLDNIQTLHEEISEQEQRGSA